MLTLKTLFANEFEQDKGQAIKVQFEDGECSYTCTLERA